MTPEDVIRHAANPFLALDIPVAAISQTDLKRKYKQLGLVFHPDKNQHPNAEEAFKVIAAAYEQLRDTAGQPALVRRFATLATPSGIPNPSRKMYKRPSKTRPFNPVEFTWNTTLFHRPAPPRACPDNFYCKGHTEEPK